MVLRSEGKRRLVAVVSRVAVDGGDGMADMRVGASLVGGADVPE